MCAPPCSIFLQLCLVNVRRFFAQRYSPFDMGDFCVLAPTQRTRVRLRVAVLHKSPHLKRFRPARPLARPSGSRYTRRFPTKASLSSAHLGANKRRRWHFRHRSPCRFVTLRSLRYFAASSPAAIIADSRRLASSLALVPLLA